MMARILLLAAIALSAIFLGACGDEARADEPPKIEYGRDTCDRCNMIISEERYASGLVNEDADKLIFDDIGEMIAFIQDDPGTYDAWRVWVHDYDTIEWIDGESAFYVHGTDVITPMAMGVLAFETEEAATTFAAENSGSVVDWETLLTDWMMPMHGN